MPAKPITSLVKCCCSGAGKKKKKTTIRGVPINKNIQAQAATLLTKGALSVHRATQSSKAQEKTVLTAGARLDNPQAARLVC